MSNFIIKKCKHHGETEFYSHNSGDRCRTCTIERRTNRRDNPELDAHDRAYNKIWTADNKVHLTKLRKQHEAGLLEEIENEKQWLFVEKVDDLRTIFKIYRPTKEFTDLELVTMSIKFSKSLTHAFNWDKFKERMKNKISNNIYMNEFVKIKSKEGWIKMVNNKMQYNYKDAPESEKIRMRELALNNSSKKLKKIKL